METKTQSRVMERKGGKHLPRFCFIECSKQPMCMHVKHHLDPGTQAQESNSYSFPGNCATPVLSQASSFPGNSDCTGSSREDQVIHFASVWITLQALPLRPLFIEYVWPSIPLLYRLVTVTLIHTEKRLELILLNILYRLGMVAHACNPRYWRG